MSKDCKMVSYAHQNDPGGTRFLQYKRDPLPPWAVDVKIIEKDTNVPGKIDFANASLDNKIELSGFLQELRTARQVAYNVMKIEPAVKPWYDEAEAMYRRFAAAIGAEPTEVFDSEKHKAKKLAEGDLIYTEAYGKNFKPYRFVDA